MGRGRRNIEPQSAVPQARDDPQAIGDGGYDLSVIELRAKERHARSPTRTELGCLVHPSGATSQSAPGRHALPRTGVGHAGPGFCRRQRCAGLQ
jgi:hypothetical protein